MIRRLHPANLPPAVREANERRMAAFIALALHERVGLDTRRSVVLYDQNFVFNLRWTGCPTSARSASCINRRRSAIGRKACDSTTATRRALAKAGARLAVCAHAIGDQPSAPGCSPTVPFGRVASSWSTGNPPLDDPTAF